ncbi:cell wall hydrolase [Thermoanaerobacterium sp. DL9XJH110]|uniref:cell wall hydrolase n=1 Tax=Thermoanaerobacterium sp. DL9XJH110 TaxID=3386643 RepID=UPI003BB7D3B0
MHILKFKKLKMAVIFMLTAALMITGVALNRRQALQTQSLANNYAVSARGGDYVLLARLVSGEARGEPYVGQVGVAAVILNRVRHPRFPGSVPGVIFQPGAFESVRNGQIWAKYPSRSNFNAARDAINGWDPTYGSLYFWNPYKRVSPWIWTRRIITRIGRHVFGR